MTWLLTLLIVVLVGIIAGAGWVIFALLKRLDTLISAHQQSAQATMSTALDMQGRLPAQMDTILGALSGVIQGHNASFTETVKTVLAPYPVAGQAVLPGQNPAAYPLPTPETNTVDSGTWDHTDLIERQMDADWPPPPGGRTDPGYGFEADPDFDPNNPLGIPGLSAPHEMVGA